MPLPFNRADYQRLKASTRPSRELALAEMRPAFAEHLSVYDMMSYLTFLLEDEPQLLEQAKLIKLYELRPDSQDTSPGRPIPNNESEAETRVSEPNPFDEDGTTRTRLSARYVEQMRACLFEALQNHWEPKSADELVDEAAALWERGVPSVKISRHKWLMHFAAWRHREPSLFRKTYRHGSNSEKDSLWELTRASLKR